LVPLVKNGTLPVLPIKDFLAATSVGIIDGQPCLDLCYEEDSSAIVDMNIVMTGEGKYVEVQGTGEEAPFSPEELNQLLALAKKGTDELIALQSELLGEDAQLIGAQKTSKS
jgi:ribonuclease PH